MSGCPEGLKLWIFLEFWSREIQQICFVVSLVISSNRCHSNLRLERKQFRIAGKMCPFTFQFDRTSSFNSCKWNELKQIPAIHLRSISSAMFAMGINLSPFTCTISSSPQWDLYWCWWSCSSFMMLFEHEEQPISMDRWHKNQSWFLTFGIVLRCVAGRYRFLIHIFSETISLFRNPNFKKKTFEVPRID